jgi:hypothetical protein
MDRVALEDALARAEHERLDFGLDFRDYLDAMNGRRGTGMLRAILDDQERLHGMTDSDLELAAVRMFDDHAIPRPRTQVWLPEFTDSPTPYRADFLWQDARVILETDGYGDHGRRTQFESDRLRAQDLTSVDYVVVPATWRQIVRDPARVAPGLKAVVERETSRRAIEA